MLLTGRFQYKPWHYKVISKVSSKLAGMSCIIYLHLATVGFPHCVCQCWSSRQVLFQQTLMNDGLFACIIHTSALEVFRIGSLIKIFYFYVTLNWRNVLRLPHVLILTLKHLSLMRIILSHLFHCSWNSRVHFCFAV